MSEYADKALIELRQLVDNAQTALDGLSADYDSTHLTRARAITQELLRDLPHIPESEKTDLEPKLAKSRDANLKSAFVIGPRRSERLICGGCMAQGVGAFRAPATWTGWIGFTPVTLSCEAHCSICDDTI